MLLPKRTDSLRTIRVKYDGSVKEEDSIPLRNTLFAHAYGADQAALLRLEVPDAEGFDAMGQRLRLAKALQKGVRGLKVLGAGHGVKAGKVYAATPEVLARVHPYFATAEDALAYGGLLFSEATSVLRLSSARVTGRGLGDGQGWIDADLLREHGLPVRQVQIRALWPKALAKGTLLPVEGMKAKEHCDVLFHETMLKSVGKDVSGDFLLAIRDTAEIRPMRSSWTWTQFLDEDLQERLFERYAKPSLDFVRRAMGSNDSALSFLDGIQMETGEEKETRDLLTAYLSAGLSPRHPWVHRKLQELVRRSYLDAALGLGPVPLSGAMVCYVDDDRCKHHITANWAPEGQYAILRYPVRDPDSLHLVQNIHRPGVPDGSIAVHPELIAQLDGDQDGDAVAITRDRDVMRGVARMHRSAYPRLPIPPRTRKRSPLTALPLVAVDALGASGIGTPTWLIGACVAEGKHALVPGLSLALQVGTMGLKWSVEKDYDFLRSVSRGVKLPEWLEMAEDRKVFATEAPKVPDVGLGRFWNLAAEAFARDTLGTRGDLQEYTPVVPLPDGDPEVLAETETMRQAFNRRVAGSEGDEAEVRAAIRSVRDWGVGKTGPKRAEYGRTAWFMAHRSRSLKSTASFAIHAFPDVLVKDIQESTGYRTPVGMAACNTCYARAETVEGRPIQRSRRPVHAPVKGNGTPTTLVRLIGGQKAIEAMYGVSEDEARLFLEQAVEGAGYDPVEVTLRWVTAPWNEHRVLRADLQGDPVGYVPEEQAEAMGERLAGKRTARLLYRGRVVYATVNL